MKMNRKGMLSVLCFVSFGLLAGCGSSTGSGSNNSAPIAPAITQQPANQTVNAGSSATFTAAASGTPAPTVQWQVSTNGGAFANVAGATSTTLTLTGTTASQNGNKYQAVFTNSAGSATTTAATLTVNVAPAITQQPANQAVNAGSTATFTAAASGTPAPTVQWQVSTNGGAFANVAGATSTTLMLTGTTVAQSGNQYQAVFTNSAGNATTTAATLTVNAAAAVIVGAAFDGPVAGATIDAFSISTTGVVSSAPIASAITKADGSYSLTLPPGFSGPVLITSLGGTYVDDVTGQTVQAGPLSVLVPNGSGSVTAELTPVTSMAAQLALQLAAAAGTSPTGIATNLNAAIGAYFGGVGDTTGTPLVDVSTANCAVAASQASQDISLIMAGISQLAAANGVTSAALTGALIQDFSSDGDIDGAANGAPIAVPLANGSGSISLCSIEGNCPGSNSSLPQALGPAITAFVLSVKNACQATMSPTTLANLNNPAFTAAFPPAGAVPISVSGKITGLNPNQTAGLRVLTTGLLNHCTTNGGCPGVGFSITGNGAFSATGGAPYAGFTGWRIRPATVSDSNNESCNVAPPITGGVTPNTAVSITGIQISCSVRTYPVNVWVSGLASGQSLQLQDSGVDTLTVSNNSFLGQPSSFATQLTYGSAYAVTISKQPSSETCAVQGSGMGTIGQGDTVYVTCGSTGTTALLSNPNGLMLSLDQTKLYLANAGGNQVVVYDLVRSGATGAVTAVNLETTITSDIVNPSRLALDATGQFLYVANFGGSSISNAWVSVYDTANNNAEVTANKISTGSITRPLGVAVDANGIVYVADNASNAISVYQPQSGGGYKEASFSPLLADAAGNSFPAPGALSFYSVSAGDFLVVGTNAGNVFVYPAPLTNTSTPLYTLSHSACSSAPTGPTGFALLVRGISGGTQSDSSFFITNFQGGDVLDYDFNNFFASNTCPTPHTQTPSGSNSSPEGVAVDAFGNVFVTNAGANSLFVYVGGLSASPTLTVQ